MENIKFSLSKGRLFDKKITIILIIFTFFLVCAPILSIIIAILVELNIFYVDKIIIISLIFLNLFTMSELVIIVRALYVNSKLRKEMSNWLNDAVKIKAILSKIDYYDEDFSPHRIRVVFRYNGKNFCKLSPKGSRLKGYVKYLNKKQVERYILYSPKYDEVMLQKEK